MRLEARKRSNRESGEAGFTLLELLVAMTLLGLLMLVLLGGLQFGTRVWEESAQGGRGQDVSLAQALFRRAVSQAYPMFDASNPMRPKVEFSGSREQLTVLAPLPLSLGEGGRARVTFAREEKDGSVALAMAAEPELASRTQSDGPRRETLLTGLKDVRFSYFGRKERNAPARWHDEWAGERWPPELVRLDVTFAEGDKRVWPLLVVKPRIAVDVSCAYDPLTRYCQGR